MVAFDSLSKLVHGPLLAHSTQHCLQLILVEALQRPQSEHLRKAAPTKYTIEEMNSASLHPAVAQGISCPLSAPRHAQQANLQWI